MKKAQIAINVVLFLGLVALFVLHFTQSPSTVKTKTIVKSDSSAVSGTIAFVQTDTIMANFDMALDLYAKIEQQFNTAQAELSSKEQKFMNEVQQLQYDMQRGLIKRADAAKKEGELQQEQQDLYMRGQELSNDLAEEQAVASRQVYEALVQYIEEYNADMGYTFVLGNEYGSNILYSDKQLDITYEILEGLNKKYYSKEKED
jgi:outer membrane protein